MTLPCNSTLRPLLTGCVDPEVATHRIERWIQLPLKSLRSGSPQFPPKHPSKVVLRPEQKRNKMLG